VVSEALGVSSPLLAITTIIRKHLFAITQLSGAEVSQTASIGHVRVREIK
jgi:hypothetical protein